MSIVTAEHNYTKYSLRKMLSNSRFEPGTLSLLITCSVLYATEPWKKFVILSDSQSGYSIYTVM